MATYSSHKLIMGKVEICKFYLSQWRYLNFFTEMFIGLSSTFHMTFVQIGVFDGCQGGKKGQFSEKTTFKNLLLRNHMEDVAETWHTC